MCEAFGSLCRLCKLGLEHEEPPQPHARKGEYFRKHHAADLAIGKHEQEKFEKHYASHGIHVDHRPTAHGDLEPVITSRKQFERMQAARA